MIMNGSLAALSKKINGLMRFVFFIFSKLCCRHSMYSSKAFFKLSRVGRTRAFLPKIDPSSKSLLLLAVLAVFFIFVLSGTTSPFLEPWVVPSCLLGEDVRFANGEEQHSVLDVSSVCGASFLFLLLFDMRFVLLPKKKS